MSRFTTEVRYICEDAAGYAESVGFEGVEEVLRKATLPDNAKRVFNFNYPFSQKMLNIDPNYKQKLEMKILLHYYTREIGEESVGLWKLRLFDKMNNIMPYYNQMYDTTLITFDPLINVSKYVSGTASKKHDEQSIENAIENKKNNKNTVNSNNKENNEGNSDISNETENQKRSSANVGSKTEDIVKTEDINKDGTLNSTGSKNNIESIAESNRSVETVDGTLKKTGTDKMHEDIDIDIEFDGDLQKQGSGTRVDTIRRTPNLTDTVNDSGTTDKHTVDRYSDTPQGAITGLEDNEYLTNARIVDENVGYTNRQQTTNKTGTDNEDNTYTDTPNYHDITDDNTRHDEHNDHNRTLDLTDTHDFDTIKTKNGSTNKSNTSTDKINQTTTGNEDNTITTKQIGNDVKHSSEENDKNKSYNRTFTKTVNESSINSILEEGTGNRNFANSKAGKYSGLEDFINQELGKYGSITYSKMLMEFRDTIINIDKMIIDSLSDLFILLWE